MLEEVKPAAGEIALYLFGNRDPEISSLMGDRGFHGLVRSLFAGETAAVPAEAPAALDRGARSGLLELQGGSFRAGPKLVPVPAVAERDVSELVRPALAHYVEIAGDVASELRQAYGHTRASARFDWRQVSHSLIAGMFLDLAMGNEVYRSGQILRRPVGDTVVWAFEGISARNAYGVQWTSGGRERTFFAQLWHSRVRRSDVRIGSSLVERMAAIAAGREMDGDPGELLYLRYLKLVRRSELQVPFFGPEDAQLLLGPLTAGARRLVADAIVPALDLLVHHPWWRERYLEQPYRHAAVRLILEYGVDRAIASKVLDPFPEAQDLPIEWGRWLWAEPEGPLTLMPNVVARES